MSKTLHKDDGEALLGRWAAIVGADNVLRTPEEMAPYMCEWRDRYRGEAMAVLLPASTDEVARILALAHESQTPVVPQGGNTGLVGGQIPFAGGREIVVALARMNAIREVDVAGNTLTVEAGATLAQVQVAAEAQDRLFPLSLAAEGSCQIGGNLSTNAGGINVLAYGNMRALTLGLEVVLPDGRIWHGLRGLRKDNTGYDLRDLFIGAEGTLGIITAAVLKLFPAIKSRAMSFVGHKSLADVAAFFNLAQQAAGGRLTMFELLPRRGIEFAVRHGNGLRDPLAEPYDWYCLVELTDSRPDAALEEGLLDILERGAEEGVVADAALAASLSQAESFRRLRESMSEVQKFEGGSIKHDVSVPVAAIPAFITRANARVQEMIPGCRPVPFGHFGDGNIHYNISQPPDMDREAFLARWDEISQAVHDLVVEMRGSISAEHGIGRMKRQTMAALKDPVELALMHEIKRAFDPHGIMNPGKVL